MSFGFWNVRGLMNPIKQAEVRQLVRHNNICCVGLLETKVPATNFPILSATLIPGWMWVSNYEHSPRGRIWVGWNPLLDRPWMVAGDFNAIKDSSDRMGSPDVWLPAFDDFKQCLDQAELFDLRYVGFRFTWSTSSGTRRKQRKIDRVLVNNCWSSAFSFLEASFLTPGLSDHTPMVVRILVPGSRRIPFKFFNMWMSHPDFSALVTQSWESQVSGSPMYKLYARLKLLKGRLKSLNREAYSDISMRVATAKRVLLLTQEALQLDPGSSSLAVEEHTQLKDYYELRAREEAFFKQKSRIRWLKEGASTPRHMISNLKEVPKVFVAYFQELLTPAVRVVRPSIQELKEFIHSPLNEDQINLLAQPFLPAEIREAMFSLAGNKAPGPDGYNADFFKQNWDKVGPTVTKAIIDFLESGCLLKEINNTIIALVPKVPNATSVSDFRPIACCNTIYKCITKIFSSRIATYSTFTLGIRIFDFTSGARLQDYLIYSLWMTFFFLVKQVLHQSLAFKAGSTYSLLGVDLLLMPVRVKYLSREALRLLSSRYYKYLASISGPFLCDTWGCPSLLRV
ncbi:hypothetical protein BT93_L2086 [Corymbia citriodora subsp. variegata]|uniref:Endonuclease/exonuclease/phosphatase domain-containing protein n=1 Tax=Corymbia citriodora subsp. variegata TaxID=360336 RepID=A0A8T0CL93_CORYI|nr:hypothetical protein BT93_L2086 [Corymbia citriodora subsp. variegata]